MKLGSTAHLLFVMLIPSTIAPPPAFAMTPPVDATNIITVEANGQLHLCHQPDPCLAAKFQANATGSDVAYLWGVLLIYSIQRSAPQSCMGNVTSRVVVSDGATAATFTGTLAPADPAVASCVGGLQGVPVILSIDSTYGMVQLTTNSPAGVTEVLGSGWGAMSFTVY